MKKIKSARVIAVVSGKGGVGKTVTTVNIAAALNLLGKNVVAVDGNISTPHLALHLGAPIVPITLHHVLKNKKDIREAVYEHHSGTKIVPGSIYLKDLYSLKLDQENFVNAIVDLRKMAQVILIDSASGHGHETLMALKAADDVIVVINPDMFSISEAIKTIKIARDLGKNIKGVVVTRTRGDDNELGIENIKHLVEEPIIAVISEDDAIRESLIVKDAVVHTDPGSQVAISYMSLAKKILGVPR